MLVGSTHFKVLLTFEIVQKSFKCPYLSDRAVSNSCCDQLHKKNPVNFGTEAQRKSFCKSEV